MLSRINGIIYLFLYLFLFLPTPLIPRGARIFFITEGNLFIYLKAILFISPNDSPYLNSSYNS